MERSTAAVPLLIGTFLETKVHASISVGMTDATIIARIEGDIEGTVLLTVSDGMLPEPKFLFLPVEVARQLPRMFEVLVARAEAAGLLSERDEYSRTKHEVGIGEVA